MFNEIQIKMIKIYLLILLALKTTSNLSIYTWYFITGFNIQFFFYSTFLNPSVRLLPTSHLHTTTTHIYPLHFQKHSFRRAIPLRRTRRIRRHNSRYL